MTFLEAVIAGLIGIALGLAVNYIFPDAVWGKDNRKEGSDAEK